jgi:hypothetical protein
MLLQHPARHLAASSSECSARPAARLKHMVARAPSRCHTASECARAAIEWTLLGVPCSASSHRAHRKKRSLVCRSTTYTDPLPEGTCMSSYCTAARLCVQQQMLHAYCCR